MIKPLNYITQKLIFHVIHAVHWIILENGRYLLPLPRLDPPVRKAHLWQRTLYYNQKPSLKLNSHSSASPFALFWSVRLTPTCQECVEMQCFYFDLRSNFNAYQYSRFEKRQIALAIPSKHTWGFYSMGQYLQSSLVPMNCQDDEKNLLASYINHHHSNF